MAQRSSFKFTGLASSSARSLFHSLLTLSSPLPLLSLSFSVIQEPFEGGKACPYEDGFEKTVGGPLDPKNFCRCNAPTYANRLTTQSSKYHPVSPPPLY